MRIALASSLVLIAPALAWAEVPDACTILTKDEINSVAGGTVEKIVPVRSGNPSECNFMEEVKAVGEHAYWSPASHTLGFHKGKTLVFVTFQQKKNANEIDSAQLGRMIEQRLK